MQPAARPARSDTTYLAAVDKDGNIVSLIQSIYDAFGSGVAVKGTGLHPAGSRRLVRARFPAIPMPWRRASGRFTPLFPRSWNKAIPISGSASWAAPINRWRTRSLSPTFVDYGMNIQAALSEPRFTVRPTEQGIGCDILIESRVDDGHSATASAKRSQAEGQKRIFDGDGTWAGSAPQFKNEREFCRIRSARRRLS